MEEAYIMGFNGGSGARKTVGSTPWTLTTYTSLERTGQIKA